MGLLSPPTLSTSGKHSAGPGGSPGRQGSVAIRYLPGAEGRLNVTPVGIQAPALGYDREPLRPASYSADPDWAVVQSDWDYAGTQDLGRGALEATKNLAGVIGAIEQTLANKIKSFSSGKIIMPLGQLYTFRDLRLSGDCASLLMNVAYAPEELSA